MRSPSSAQEGQHEWVDDGAAGPYYSCADSRSRARTLAESALERYSTALAPRADEHRAKIERWLAALSSSGP